MITKKEDLYGTVIEVNSIDDANFVAGLCEKFGIELGYWSGCEFDDRSVCAKVSHNNGANGGYLVFSGSIEVRVDDMSEFKDLKKLTLSDLKPRTKVEYEKVNSLFEIDNNEFMNDKYVFSDNEDYRPVSSERILIKALQTCSLYRKVERPVEWWEDAAEYIKSLGVDAAGVNRDSGVKKLYIHGELDECQAKELAKILSEQKDENQNNASS